MRRSDILLGLLILLVTAGLVVASFIFLNRNKISHANRLKRSAKKDYLAHEYVRSYFFYKELIDSLQVNEDPVFVNHANAAYLSSELLLKKKYHGSVPGDMQNQSDSAFKALADESIMQYHKMMNAADKKIASIAANQLGYAAVRSIDAAQPGQLDSLFAESLSYFKEALKRDPANDSARYNYELLKKITGYSETILAQARALVAQKKYKQAAILLEDGMRRDIRLKKNADFLQRLKTVITIDTLKRRLI